jgi:hypothetical protein
MRNYFIYLIVCLTTCICSGQTVDIPKFDDKYCKYISQLEKGETNIDYQDFRFSFLESKQFVIAKQKLVELNNLENQLYEEMDKENYPEIIRITRQMLSIDYTSLIAHKILRQTYEIIGEREDAAKYKTIQFGLLKSITEKGDGKNCATGWPVIQISEEYFILQMLGAELIEQSINNTNGICDKMVVKINGEERTYYFEITKVFEGYQKR